MREVLIRAQVTKSKRRSALVVLAAAALALVFATGCAVQSPSPTASSPNSGAAAPASDHGGDTTSPKRAPTLTPTKTDTLSPMATIHGTYSPEYFRSRYESWPEGYKIAVNQDVAVLFAYPAPLADWVEFAFIHHIPSGSSVALGRPGGWSQGTPETSFGDTVIVQRHYNSNAGRQALESVLADEQLMRRILNGPPGDGTTSTATQ